MTDDAKKEREAVLLPCPFCGGEAEVEQKGTTRQSHIISCTDCHCSLETNETFGAGALWNKRQPQTDALKMAREAAIEECALLVEGMGTSHDSHAGERFAKAIRALKESK